MLFALAFAVFAFAGGVLVGQSRSSGGARGDHDARSTSRRRRSQQGRPSTRSAGCGTCHVLAAAGSEGKIGPNLDDAKPDAARVVDVVTNGKGVMPSYRDRLTAAQIEQLAAFVSTSAGGSAEPNAAAASG